MSLKIEHHHHNPFVVIWFKTTQVFQSNEYTQIFIMTIQRNWNKEFQIINIKNGRKQVIDKTY